MLLHDKPESADIRFGHKVISEWLGDQIEDVQLPFRLAITSGLGTGKSTILHAALDELQKKKRDSFAISRVDIWKLDKESVRRSALIRIAKDLIKEPAEIEKLRESLYGNFSEASYIRPLRRVIDKVGVSISTFLFIGLIVIVYMILSSLQGTNNEPWWWKAIVSVFVAVFNLASRLLEKSFVHIQRTFNRAPMIGAEEFEEGLQQILEHHELANKKVVLLFDNIDRAAPALSRAILAGISAFFDHSSHERFRNVLIIVPFAPSCLTLTSEGERPIIEDCDKMFDAIIPLPKLTVEDLSDFAFDHLRGALEGYNYSDELLRDLAYLISFSPFRSPREIKQIVNHLYCRLNLAKSFETKSDSCLQLPTTLLPAGTITKHSDTLLKLFICEKIFPEFTETVVNIGMELEKAFEASDESAIFQSELFKKDQKRILMNFLQATTEIPKKMPPSAAPFLFLKGPDQVISIPSGHLMSEALFMSDTDKLREAAQGKNGAPVTHMDIATVVRYHRKKYTKNTQALKNAVRSIFLGLNEFQKFEGALAIEVCEILLLVPDMLKEISPLFVAKYTNDNLEASAIQKVWTLIDSEFRKISDSAELAEKENLKWASEYFHVVYKQTDGIKRSGLDSMKLPLRLILSDHVFESLGKIYPANYCTPKDILESVKRYIDRSDEVNALKYSKITTYSFSATPDFEECEKHYQEISMAWQAAAGKWVSSQDPGLAEILAEVIYYWPLRVVKSKTYFDQLKSWMMARVQNLNQKVNSGVCVDVLDLCLAFYGQGVVDGNFDNITRHGLTVINCEQVGTLRQRYNEPNRTIWKPLLDRVKPHLVSAM